MILTRLLCTVFMLFVLSVVTVTTAQGRQPQCPVVVEQALESFDGNCNDIEQNSACYGNFFADVTFKEGIDSALWDSPGDRAELASLATIRTTNNIAEGEWGIAALTLQLREQQEDTTAKEKVQFLLIGDVEIEDAGDENTASPLQTFYFRQGLGATQCDQAPSVLAIHNTGSSPASLKGNGAHIEITSTALLQIQPPGNTLKLMTITGNVVVEPDTLLETTIPEGFSTLRCLGEPADLGIDGLSNDQRVVDSCAWTQPEGVTKDDLALASLVNDMFNRTGNACPNGTTNIEHRVEAGENLFRIARKYATSIDSIVVENNLINSRVIIVGQVLHLSCVMDTGLPAVVPPKRP